jgi:hypothetical protein
MIKKLDLTTEQAQHVASLRYILWNGDEEEEARRLQAIAFIQEALVSPDQEVLMEDCVGDNRELSDTTYKMLDSVGANVFIIECDTHATMDRATLTLSAGGEAPYLFSKIRGYFLNNEPTDVQEEEP